MFVAASRKYLSDLYLTLIYAFGFVLSPIPDPDSLALRDTYIQKTGFGPNQKKETCFIAVNSVLLKSSASIHFYFEISIFSGSLIRIQ